LFLIVILVHISLVTELGRCSYFPMIFGHYPNTKWPKLILLHAIFNAPSRPFSHHHCHLTKGVWGLGNAEEHFKQLLTAIYLQEIIFFLPLVFYPSAFFYYPSLFVHPICLLPFYISSPKWSINRRQLTMYKSCLESSIDQ